MANSAVRRRPIRRLASATVERIAAGEVVERPASVVKELVENALDAGATAVTVRIEGGGIDRVSVADDGIGIPPEELDLAVERHATSKIEPEGPVERIGTLGFRGEALAAIAAVARLRLISRPPDHEVAEGISVIGGALAGRFVEARSPGTTVEVSDLFFNTPARRKFLRSPAAEQVEVAQTLERIYLAHPPVTLRFESEGREVATYPTSSDLRDAAARVLGTEFLTGSFPVGGEIPSGRIHAVLGRPALAAPSSRSLYLGVNGRAIASRSLQQAVRVAFGDYLPRNRFPVGVVHLEVSPTDLDVNVHPTKREVRFAREREIAEAVRVRVREGLIAAPQVAELANRIVGPSLNPPRTGPPPWSWDLPSTPSSRARTPGGVTPHQQTLEGVGLRALPSEVAPTPGHPRLLLLGCLGALYWIGEGEDGLVLVDQHAASERVVYESLRRAQSIGRQALVEPVPLRLSGVQRSALEAHSVDVARAGFEVEPFGPDAYCVRTVPSFSGRRARPESVAHLLDELAAGGRPTEPDGLVERTTATLACHAAIRAGDVVTSPAFARVLDALYALPESAYSCPHGRPIVLRIPWSRIDRWFLRSGP
ncbi:MAG TPA: DNA mismatch repair endonuclease MutL [Thermoplasmata archaeon]|nr:DNA mismatch repair endonuclease MutL [Thermoplasmata archaeon]